MLTDIHAHLHHFSLEQLDAVMAECRAQGVGRIITCAYDFKTLKATLPALKAFPNVYVMLGVHPQNAWGRKAQNRFLAYMQRSAAALAAVGEVGYDAYPDNPPVEFQTGVFLSQLEFAATTSLPLVLHIREAFDIAWADIDRVFPQGAVKPACILHSYSGGFKQLEPALDRGCYFSFGGALTYSRSTRLKRIAAAVPLDRIVLETDSPFIPPAALPPVAQSLPQDISVIFAALTELRPESRDTVKATLQANVERIFDFNTLDAHREEWINLLETNLKSITS